VAAIPIGLSLVMIETPPNSLESVNIDIATECPIFWDVPEKVMGTEVFFGGCALECGHLYVNLVDELNATEFYTYLISSIIYLATTVNLIVTPAKKRNIYSCTIIFVKVLACIISGIHKGTTDEVSAVCETKTASYDVPVHNFAGAICMAEGISYYISQLIVVGCVYCAILELWFRVVWSVKDISKIQRIYRSCTVGLVVMQTLIFYLGLGEMTLGGSRGRCWYVLEDIENRFYSYFIPQIVFYITGLAFSFHVIYVCITISLRTTSKAERWYFKVYKFWKLYKVLFLIVAVFFLSNFLSLFIRETYLYDNMKKYSKSLVEFMECLFNNFVSYEKDNTRQVCGTLPKDHVSPYYLIFFNIFEYLNDYLWFFITLNNDVKTFWYTKFQLLFGKDSKLFKVRTVESSVYQSESNSKGDEDDEDVELSKYEKPDVMISSFNSKIVPLDVESASNNVIDYESKNCE